MPKDLPTWFVDYSEVCNDHACLFILTFHYMIQSLISFSYYPPTIAMGGDAMIGQSTINIMNGARHRVSSTMSGVFMLLFTLVLSPFINLLPISTLTGVLFMVVLSTFQWKTFVILRYGRLSGKSAFELFCCVLWCVQYEDSVIRILHLNLVCFNVIAFAKPNICCNHFSFIFLNYETRIFQIVLPLYLLLS